MEVGTEKCLLSRVCPKLTAYLIHQNSITDVSNMQKYNFRNFCVAKYLFTIAQRKNLQKLFFKLYLVYNNVA